MGASPAAAIALTRMNAESTSATSCRRFACRRWCCTAPATARCCVEEGRYVASLIPDAKFVELPGDDHLPFVGDQDALLDEIERFLASARTRVDTDRVLATLLCGEADPSRQAPPARFRSAAGARRRPCAALRRQRRAGRRTDASSWYSTVRPAPSSAAARSPRGPPRRIAVRLGLHTGECDLVDGVPHGVVVDIGSRVAALARASEILVTRTVVDLVAGSGLRFGDRGSTCSPKGTRAGGLYAVREDHEQGPAKAGHYRNTAKTPTEMRREAPVVSGFSRTNVLVATRCAIAEPPLQPNGCGVRSNPSTHQEHSNESINSTGDRLGGSRRRRSGRSHRHISN